MEQHLIEGSILAAAIVFAFLANIRTTLISALAIPTSIISTFALMAAIGFDLNQITMLALTLMVGIVIDDAIIVLENIYRFMEEKGMSPYQAAIEGTKDIGLAVMATTFSLLAVFLPIGFMGGIVGRFMSSFGFTASFAIAVSLAGVFHVDSDADVAVRESASPSRRAKSRGVPKIRASSASWTPITQACWSGPWRIARPWWPSACAVVLSSVPLFMLVGKNFIPADDRSEFQANIRAPEGTSLAATVTITERIARDFRALPGVVATLTSVGDWIGVVYRLRRGRVEQRHLFT